MTFQVYGCHAQAGDATWLPPILPVYIVSAHCEARCHFMSYLVSLEALERAQSASVIFDLLQENFEDAFARAHP